MKRISLARFVWWSRKPGARPSTRLPDGADASSPWSLRQAGVLTLILYLFAEQSGLQLRQFHAAGRQPRVSTSALPPESQRQCSGFRGGAHRSALGSAACALPILTNREKRASRPTRNGEMSDTLRNSGKGTEVRRRCLASGRVLAYLSKPIDETDFLSAVRVAVEKAGRTP